MRFSITNVLTTALSRKSEPVGFQASFSANGNSSSVLVGCCGDRHSACPVTTSTPAAARRRLAVYTRRTRTQTAVGSCQVCGVRREPIRYGSRVAYEPTAAVAVNVDHVLTPWGDLKRPSVLRLPLSLRVLVLPPHGRVPLYLELPPRRDDAALQRRMRWRDETVGRSNVCEQAFHNVCSVSMGPLRARRRANNPPPSSSNGPRVRRSTPSVASLPPRSDGAWPSPPSAA